MRTPSSTSDQHGDDGSGVIAEVQQVMEQSQKTLWSKGPNAALELLMGSPHRAQVRLVQRMQAIAYIHQGSLQQRILQEPALDSIWCQCDVCQSTWLISPEMQTAPWAGSSRKTPRQCRDCRRTYCSDCVVSSRCACNGELQPMRRPNGRKRSPAQQPSVAEPHRAQSSRRDTDDTEVSLYFGYDRTIPVGIDRGFPIEAVADPSDHLSWATELTDRRLFYHAAQQLGLVTEPIASSAVAMWLRARLDLVILHNRIERSQRRLDRDLLAKSRRPIIESIKSAIDRTLSLAPDFGPAWLLAAEVYSDRRLTPEFARAVESAERARVLLNGAPRTLVVLGRALRGSNRSREAVAIFESIPLETTEHLEIAEELELAKLEVRVSCDPVDVAAHVELGRWALAHHDRDRASLLFERLRTRCPERAEGYHGLGELALTDRPQRLADAHAHATEAIRLDPRLGVAHQLLGTVHEVLRHRASDSEVVREDPLAHYRRALELDPSCDRALTGLAEDAINRSDIKQALVLLERAKALDTRISQVYFLLAAIYRGHRRHEDEHHAMAQAMELAPDIGLSAEYEQRILDLCGFEY
jgi:tetratricopeptide (TPR) repeat protein